LKATQAAAISRISLTAVAAWTHGRREYSGEPLETVVDDLNRYLDRRVVITDPQLRSIRVSGTVSEANVKGWLESLQLSLPILITDRPGGAIEIRAPD
jgi:transmembrane sensor